MMPCYSGMDRKGSKPWPAGGVSTSTRYDRPIIADLSLGEEEPDSNGGQRRRLGIDEAYPEQYVPRCFPRVVIFPRIKRQDQSTLTPMR